MMTAAPLDLQELRQRLDAIDDRLQDLLIDRAEVVALVADHKRSNNLNFYRPEREAEIIRRLAARHHGPLPLVSLIRIWREMLAAAVRLETPFAVAVYAPAGSPGFWDLARDHFGSNTPIAAHGSIAQVIGAVAEAPDWQASCRCRNRVSPIPGGATCCRKIGRPRGSWPAYPSARAATLAPPVPMPW